MLKSWKKIDDKRVLLEFAEGSFYVSVEDFNRAFGTMISNRYEVVKDAYAIE